MMTIKLSDRWINRMRSLPESGMGYHRVKIMLNNGAVLGGVVWNSDILRMSGDTLFGVDDIAWIDLL